MAQISLLRGFVGAEGTLITGVAWEGPEFVFHVRPAARQRGRCGVCRRPSPGYDSGGARRRWRTLDMGTVQAYYEADAPRVQCRRHGVVVAHVPWAAHRARHTHAFDQYVVWLAMQVSKTAAAELMRVSWRTVGNILARCWERIEAARGGPQGSGLDGLARIGIDEVSYRRGQQYLTVVVDHDTGRLVWARPGRDAATVEAFFDDLGPQRSAAITHVSADQATWISSPVTRRAPQAVQCADPFHVVKWANEAVNAVRTRAWRAARKAGQTRPNGYDQGRRRYDSTEEALELRNARHSLWKNPENLTDRQQQRLDWIASSHPELWEAYRLKEGLRTLLKMSGTPGIEALTIWLDWARNSGIAEFTRLADRVAAIRARIDATLTHGLSNALVESLNTKIRLLTRLAFGFHGPQPLIALAMFKFGAHQPTLPGRHPRN